MEKIKFDISKIKVTDLDNNVIPLQFNTFLGNFIYVAIREIDWLDIAKGIHAGKPVELTKEQAHKLIDIIKLDECNLIMAVKNALITHLNKLIN